MASSVYRSARATPRGTTTSTAPHPRHRYRRASTVLDAGPASGSSGPSTSRPRRPWPTTRSGLPGSRLAAPQPGQLAGRTAEHDGGTCAQNLTSIPDDACVASLDSLQSPSAERGGRTVGATTARHLFVRAPCPGIFSGAAPTTSAASRTRNAHARRGRRTSSRAKTHYSACARSGRDPSVTLLSNSRAVRASAARPKTAAQISEDVVRVVAARIISWAIHGGAPNVAGGRPIASPSRVTGTA